MPGHEDTSTAGLSGALTAETGNLAVAVNLVELENSQFDLLLLVLDLLGGSVSLLFALLGASQEVDVEVQGGHSGNVGKKSLRREGLASEREALSIGSDT